MRLNKKTDYPLSKKLRCPKCGTEMYRRHDNRAKCAQRWTCKSGDCRTIIVIDDDSLLDQTTELLNMVIHAPQVIRDTDEQSYEPPIEVRKIENEIGRAIDATTMDTDALKSKMMECISMKYVSLPPERNTATRLQAELEATSPLSGFSADITNKVLTAVCLAENGAVAIKLRNGQIIQKEES